MEKDHELEVFLALMYREDTERCSFSKHILSKDLNINIADKNILTYKYFKDIDKYPFQSYRKSKKQTRDFDTNYKHLMSTTEESSLICRFLKLIMDKDFANTTYICQGNDSTTFVSSKRNLCNIFWMR